MVKLWKKFAKKGKKVTGKGGNLNWKKVSYQLFKMVEWIVKKSPNSRQFYINLLGSLGYRLDFWRKSVVQTNLQLAFPSLPPSQREKWVREIYQNFATNLVDFIYTKQLQTPEELKKWVKLEIPPETLSLCRTRPVVFVTAHFGNWELIPLAMGAFITPLTVVARQMDNPDWDREIRTHREKFNVEIIYKKGALGRLLRELKKGKSVGMLPDQNTARQEGVETRWFGKKVLQSPSPILLAQKVGVPVVTLFCEPNWRKGEPPWKIVCRDIYHPTGRVEEGVYHLAKVMEEEIARYPTFYYWFHKRFKHFYEEEYRKK
jgi:KDO2-lipid IV(A) lauroyltransferase